MPEPPPPKPAPKPGLSKADFVVLRDGDAQTNARPPPISTRRTCAMGSEGVVKVKISVEPKAGRLVGNPLRSPARVGTRCSTTKHYGSFKVDRTVRRRSPTTPTRTSWSSSSRSTLRSIARESVSVWRAPICLPCLLLLALYRSPCASKASPQHRLRAPTTSARRQPDPEKASEPESATGKDGRWTPRVAEAVCSTGGTPRLKMAFKPGESGGPTSGDGTLRNAEGAKQTPRTRATAFGSRILFGWDLRGAEGVYGPKYQNQVRTVLGDQSCSTTSARASSSIAVAASTAEAKAHRRSAKRPRAPADIEMRWPISSLESAAETLPHPDAIWALSTEAPKRTTNSSPLAVTRHRGKTLYADSCSRLPRRRRNGHHDRRCT